MGRHAYALIFAPTLNEPLPFYSTGFAPGRMEKGYDRAKQAANAYCRWKGIEGIFGEDGCLKEGMDPLRYIGLIQGMLRVKNPARPLTDRSGRYGAGYQEDLQFRRYILQISQPLYLLRDAHRSRLTMHTERDFFSHN